MDAMAKRSNREVQEDSREIETADCADGARNQAAENSRIVRCGIRREII